MSIVERIIRHVKTQRKEIEAAKLQYNTRDTRIGFPTSAQDEYDLGGSPKPPNGGKGKRRWPFGKG